MATGEQFVGIDVSKHWLDLAVLPSGAQWRLPNDEAGWATLCQRWQAQPPPVIVLEASGKYERGVVTALAAAGMPPVVADPFTLRRYAQGLGQRAKTDRLDARLLAQYGAERQPEPRPLPTATEQALQELLVRRRQLTTMLVMEQNRRQQAAAVVVPSHDALIAALEAERTAIDAQLAAVVATDPVVQTRVARLITVPGINVVSATALVGLLPQLGTGTPKELASFVGLAPYAHDSGQRHAQRHISGGHAQVRQTLYQVVLTTTRCEPHFRAHYQHLRAAPNAKPAKVALVACMRKLLGILNAMLRDQLTWQETDVGRGHFLALAA